VSMSPESLIECVPNVSEGRDHGIIKDLSARVEAVAGVRLLDVHWDTDHNRSVYTFVGSPAAVEEAAFALTSRATNLIDLRHHQGVHPRIGATDVIPFVPLTGSTMEDCVRVARELGARIGGELRVPVYLYGAAAMPGRPQSLHTLRGAGFEAMHALGTELPRPDFGPNRLHPSAGAVAVGARTPLIALNVMLADANIEGAKRLASRIRETSGGLKGVQAMGVMLESRGVAQVSMNLVDYHVNGIALVLRKLREEAGKAKVTLATAELVGLAPEAALVQLDPQSLPGLPGPEAAIEARLRG
jgi:glutamate formiminotransferase